MFRKPSKQNAARQLVIREPDAKNEAEAVARALLRPSVRNAVSITNHSQSLGSVDLTALVEELSRQSRAVSEGDMRRPEAMLVCQAHTLDALFAHLLIKAQQSTLLNQFELYSARRRSAGNDDDAGL